MMNSEDRYDSLFQFYGEKYSIDDWRRLKAQDKQESAFNPDAVNPGSKATGLSQFMKRTWEEWRDGTAGIQEIPDVDLVMLDPRDPEDAIRAQAAYMAWLMKQFGGNWELALAAYNWGIGNLKRALRRGDWKSSAEGDRPVAPTWKSALPPETQNYLVRIVRFYEEYKMAA